MFVLPFFTFLYMRLQAGIAIFPLSLHTYPIGSTFLLPQALAICAQSGGQSPAIDAWHRDPEAAVFSNVSATPGSSGGGGGAGGAGGAKAGDSAAEEWGESFKAGGYR